MQKCPSCIGILAYWHIGKQINIKILQGKRAKYGKQVIASLSTQLSEKYGRGWSEKQLRHCLHFVETFPDKKIISTLWRQLTWSQRLQFYMKVPEKVVLKRLSFFVVAVLFAVAVIYLIKGDIVGHS